MLHLANIFCFCLSLLDSKQPALLALSSNIPLPRNALVAVSCALGGLGWPRVSAGDIAQGERSQVGEAESKGNIPVAIEGMCPGPLGTKTLDPGNTSGFFPGPLAHQC